MLFNRKVFVFIIISIFLLACQGTEQEKSDELVDITTLDSTIVIDLKYATTDNFLGEKLYSANKCYLRKSVAERLVRVQQALRKKGLGLKVWDGYRPLSVQWKMWEKVSDPKYVADPRKGSNHNRGAAVDITLVDSLGRELEMPTGFDDFTEKARSDYNGGSERAIANRTILHEAMKAEGFIPLSSEWWHFNDPECKKYPILDIPINKLSQQKY